MSWILAFSFGQREVLNADEADIQFQKYFVQTFVEY